MVLKERGPGSKPDTEEIKKAKKAFINDIIVGNFQMGEFINFDVRGIGVRPTNATLAHLDTSSLDKNY